MVLSNPDMLHSGILPHHPRWAKLFENLRYVVIDELHAYRGVFGSHLVNILRRLRRVCAHYGSAPVFICSSATIANPKELAEGLRGETVELVERNGAPRGEKIFALVNPPVVNPQLGIRRSYVAETRRLATMFLKRRLLAAVTAAVARAHTLVTFNGKSFDVPFMEMRWLYQRLETPLPALRYLDLLHPARRLWGPETGGLGGLEDRVLGFRRDDDVPGFEIPARYFEYRRSGDARPLRGVIAHNQLDLVSLGVLTGMACDVVDRGAQAADSGRQNIGLGRLYERDGREADAPGAGMLRARGHAGLGCGRGGCARDDGV